MDDYAAFLERLGKNTPEIIGAGVYVMAGTVADAVKRNLKALPAKPDTEGFAAWREGRKASLTISEKKGLEKSFGISPMKNERGYYNVKLGFSGYNELKTRDYPDGQPNVIIARDTESGSSVREKTPFIRPAVTAVQKEALEKARTEIDKRIFDMEQTKK